MSQPPFDPNKTVIGGPVDPNRTMAMGAPPRTGDPTTAFIPPSTDLVATVINGRASTMANGPAREQFLLEITAPDGGGLPGMVVSGPRTPLNLCLVLDRSGSMEGAPLEYAKQACAQVIDMLGPQDVLSIVLFEQTVDVLMNPQNVTDTNAVKNGLNQITAGNTTDLYGGISKAAGMLAERKAAGRATRMIVLSDGEPTQGVKEFATFTTLADELKANGITCTFLGFGPDYNEELLATMAKRSGGNYYYISQPHLLPEIFRTELNKLMTVAATNLKLRLKMARWTQLRSASGHSIPPGAQEFELNLADIERGATLSQGFDVEFPNHPLGHYRVMGGSLSYDETATGQTRSVPVDFIMEFTAESRRYSAPVDPKVQGALQVSAASRIVEKTIFGLKTQAITVAAGLAELEKTQALLMNQGRVSDAQEVTLAIQAIKGGDVTGAEKTLMGTVVKLDQGKS